MRYDPQKELAVLSTPSTSLANLPSKSAIILIRWPVILISCSLIFFRTSPIPFAFLVDLIFGLYALSNLGLYFINQQSFLDLKFDVLLVALDTLALTAALVINGQAETNLYVAYFLLIIACSIFENPRIIAIVSLAAPCAYATFFFEPNGYEPGNYLQLVFLFIVGIFYGHFSHLVRARRILVERVEQRSQAKAELLNIFSHELKRPLTVIGSYSQALKSGALGEINLDQGKALGKILRQTETLEHIVNVILESASVETGAITVHQEELALSEFLDEIKQNFEGIVLNLRIAFTWDYPPSMPVVLSDPGKLKIILLNLINNAVKFTDEGEVRISAQHDAERRKIVFGVKDTGIGIAPEQLPFVFEKFWQVDLGPTRTQSGGWGFISLRLLLACWGEILQ